MNGASRSTKDYLSSPNIAKLDHEQRAHTLTHDLFDVHSKENAPNFCMTGNIGSDAPITVLPHPPMKSNKAKGNTIPDITHKSSGTKGRSPNVHVLKRKKNPTIMSSLKKKGGKLLKKTLTPPRHLDVGCGKTPKRPKTPGTKLIFGSENDNDNPFNDSDDDNGVDNLTLSPKFKNATQYEIRSCELDPSNFQLEMPSHERVLANCKLCATMDNYVELVGVNFDFSDLMPWGKKVNANVTDPSSTAGDTGGKNTLNGKSNGQQLDACGSKAHQILVNLQNAVSDIVVEGFFREYYEDPNREDGLGRVEVCIFSSSDLNQIFVVYRGSSDVQDRPINGVQEKARVQAPTKTSSANSKKIKTENDLNALILDAYNCNLEESVFTLLNRLTGLRPFCDVTMVGHSFGGALSTIAAYKYAMSRPATRVRCQTFGSPRLGGADFRNDVHSLPNLNVTKIERSTDPFISTPEGVEWTHVGHTLRINQSVIASLGMRIPAEMRPVEFQLYRFDKHRPGTNLVTMSVNSVNNLRKLKIGNEIKSYQKDLDKVDSLNLPWVDSFVGFENEGKQISSGYYA